MAYNSDTQVKNALMKIAGKANLKNLVPRCFSESHFDQLHWTKGGLTFGPKNCLYGSNDVRFFYNEPYFKGKKQVSDKTPALIIEGTYGTKTGNTGSAQYARFSHSLGVAIEGFVGIYFIPFESIYRKADGKQQKVYVRCNMLQAALNVSNLEKGQYLFVDANNENLMIDLLKAFDSRDQGKINLVIKKVKQIMRDFIDAHWPKKKPLLYNHNRIGKLLMFNVVDFTDFNFRTKEKYKSGRFRNGHTILGEALILSYLFENKSLDLILPRFTHEDCLALDSFQKKEWLLLRNKKNINIVTLDDLVFKNINLKNELYSFLDTLPLSGNARLKKNQLVKEIKLGLFNNEITINYKTVKEKNG
mgnify:FL=1